MTCQNKAPLWISIHLALVTPLAVLDLNIWLLLLSEIPCLEEVLQVPPHVVMLLIKSIAFSRQRTSRLERQAQSSASCITVVFANLRQRYFKHLNFARCDKSMLSMSFARLIFNYERLGNAAWSCCVTLWSLPYGGRLSLTQILVKQGHGGRSVKRDFSGGVFGLPSF